MDDDEMSTFNEIAEQEDPPLDVDFAVPGEDMKDNPYQGGHEALMGASDRNRSKRETSDPTKSKKTYTPISKPQIKDTMVSYDMRSFLDMLNEKLGGFSFQLGNETVDLKINDLRMRKDDKGVLKVDLRVGGKHE